MPTYKITLMTGESLNRTAHHYAIDGESGRIIFFKSAEKEDEDFILFKHGVISIEPLMQTPGIPPMTGASRKPY
jgi:hypothetical protein